MLNIIILSITTVFIGVFLQKSSKYLSFSYNNITVEIPMMIVIIGSAILILLQFYLIKVAIKNWWINRRLVKSIQYAKKSLFALIAGNAVISEKFALKIDPRPPFGWLGLLLATSAAKQQRNLENCNKYIIKAEILANQYKEIIKDPNELATFGIIKVDLYATQMEYHKCIFELKKLYIEFPKYTPILSKLIELYKITTDWVELIKLLPYVKKSKLYSNNDYQMLELLAYSNRIEQLATNNEPIDLIVKFFKSAPKVLKENHKFILAYANCLFRLEYYELTEKIIKNYLNDRYNNWSTDLVKLYSKIPSNNLNIKIKAAEAWLGYHSQDQELLLTLGKLCMQADLLGKAKNYFERALEIAPTSECYVELGKLAGVMGEQSKSLEFYRKIGG